MTLARPAQESPSVAAARLLGILEAKFGDGLKAVRPPHARGPEADAESLRLAYLDLLKLALCDLVGTRTTSVARTLEGLVMSRELDGDQLRFRTAGMDWPLHGLTMVGLARLDDLQSCVESLVRDGVPGDLIEAGSWRGGASILIRATLDSLGAGERTLYVCDSFQGFPQVESPGNGYDLDADLAGVDFLAVPLAEVEDSFARLGVQNGVSFVPGFFEDTLPQLTDRRWALIRLDGDTYEATRFSLETLYPGLAAGGYLVIDDYFQIDPCREAVDDFRREHGISEPIETIDWSGARWRREQGPAGLDRSPSPAPAAPAPARHPRPVARKPPGRVMAFEEVELRGELEQLSARLAAAEAEVRRLVEHPLRGPRAWAARRAAAIGRRVRTIRGGGGRP
jgi:O-methyltransferase